MPDEEPVPDFASDALTSARNAENSMRHRARSIRPSLALVGLASGSVTAAVLLPEPWNGLVGVVAFLAVIASTWLFQRAGSRRLLAQPDQHVMGRLMLIGVVVLMPITAMFIGATSEHTWVVAVLALAIPVIMIVVPWWWEKDLNRDVAPG